MAEEYAGAGVTFAFVYVREAHPADSFPGHISFAQKLDHARAMVERWRIKRTTLVDDLDGSVHRAYGLLPNMAYVITAGGRILYRADWTDPHTLRTALEQVLHERRERRASARMAPFRVEWMPMRHIDYEAFLEGLLEFGRRPVEEFIAAISHTRGEAAARHLRKWWERKRDE